MPTGLILNTEIQCSDGKTFQCVELLMYANPLICLFNYTFYQIFKSKLR